MFDLENKKKLYTVGFSCAIIFIILYFITNFSIMSGFFSRILSVLTPIIVGAAIAYMLNPILKIFEYKILKKLKSKSARRALSLVFTYVTAFLIIVAFLWLMIPQLIQSIKDLTEKFDSYIENTTSLINSLINKMSSTPEAQQYVDSEAIIEAVTNFLVGSGNVFETVFEYVKQFGMGLFIGVKNTFLGIFISIYILIDKERLHAQVRRLTAAFMKEKSKNRLFRYVRIANRTFGGFFIGKIADSIIIGIITLFALLIFNIPYAPLVSTIIGITNIIPVFGPFIGAIPSAFIIFIASPQKALVFLILILLIQQLDGNVIGPKILGNSTGISSLGVIVAIVIMGEYFGVVGMIVGVPIFATIIIIINELIETKLKSKGLPHSAEDYFPAYSLVDPHEHHEKIGERIFGSLFRMIKGLFKKLRKKEKEENTQKKEEKDERSDD